MKSNRARATEAMIEVLDQNIDGMRSDDPETSRYHLSISSTISRLSNKMTGDDE